MDNVLQKMKDLCDDYIAKIFSDEKYRKHIENIIKEKPSAFFIVSLTSMFQKAYKKYTSGTMISDFVDETSFVEDISVSARPMFKVNDYRAKMKENPFSFFCNFFVFYPIMFDCKNSENDKLTFNKLLRREVLQILLTSKLIFDFEDFTKIVVNSLTYFMMSLKKFSELNNRITEMQETKEPEKKIPEHFTEKEMMDIGSKINQVYSIYKEGNIKIENIQINILFDVFPLLMDRKKYYRSKLLSTEIQILMLDSQNDIFIDSAKIKKDFVTSTEGCKIIVEFYKTTFDNSDFVDENTKEAMQFSNLLKFCNSYYEVFFEMVSERKFEMLNKERDSEKLIRCFCLIKIYLKYITAIFFERCGRMNEAVNSYKDLITLIHVFDEAQQLLIIFEAIECSIKHYIFYDFSLHLLNCAQTTKFMHVIINKNFANVIQQYRHLVNLQKPLKDKISIDEKVYYDQLYSENHNNKRRKVTAEIK